MRDHHRSREGETGLRKKDLQYDVKKGGKKVQRAREIRGMGGGKNFPGMVVKSFIGGICTQ